MKNAYVNYLVPIVSYGAALWKPSRIDLTMLEIVQSKPISWILKSSNSVVSEQTSETQHFATVSISRTACFVTVRKKIVAGKCICKQMRLQKSESGFWYRGCHFTNLLNECLKFKIIFDLDHKCKLLELQRILYLLTH